MHLLNKKISSNSISIDNCWFKVEINLAIKIFTVFERSIITFDF